MYENELCLDMEEETTMSQAPNNNKHDTRLKSHDELGNGLDEVERSKRSAQRWTSKYEAELKFRKAAERKLREERLKVEKLKEEKEHIEKQRGKKITDQVMSLKRRNVELTKQFKQVDEEHEAKKQKLLEENRENNCLLETLIEAANECSCNVNYSRYRK